MPEWSNGTVCKTVQPPVQIRTSPPILNCIGCDLIDIDEDKIPDILSLEEIKKFLTAAKLLNHQCYPVWCFAILTGMRSGELYALTWDQIDLEKDLILIDRSYDSSAKSSGPTKGRYW